MAELFSWRSFVHATAGSFAGCTAITIFYPLNVVRTRHQLAEVGKSSGVLVAMKEIMQKEGVPALYNALWGNICCLGTSNFVYFYIYNGLRAVLLARKRRSRTPEVISANLNLLVSSISGTFNVLLTNPLWVASMRMMMQKKKDLESNTHEEFSGVLDTVFRIGRCEGVAALWNGAGASVMLVSNPVFQFVVYEKVKKLMLGVSERRKVPIRSIEFFLMAAFAKAVATVLTYPVQLAQSRLRNSRNADQSLKYCGTADCILKTLEQEGFLGLFRGMEAKLWQTVLAAAFHFLAYEKIIQVIQLLLRRSMRSKRK